MLAALARKKHAVQRMSAYEFAQSSIAAAQLFAPQFSFGPMDAGVLRQWRSSWYQHDDRTVFWDWEQMHRKYRKRYNRFEVALWSGNELCGLSLGRFSTARTILRVEYVEGSPLVHPLRGYVLGLVVQLAEIIAQAYEASFLHVTEPAPHVQRRLIPLGYRYVAKGTDAPYDFCERRLT